MRRYAQSGVNLKNADTSVRQLKPLVEVTFSNWDGDVLTTVGSFGSVLKHPDGSISGYSTDGVGTKVIIASLLERYDTIGQDLVAMSANDLAAVGIMPRVFLDYIAVHTLNPEQTTELVSGVARACAESGMVLVGGEIAEMRDVYREGHFDLAGFAVGFGASENELITGANIRAGMGVYGVPSSGVHSNGYSLVRSVFALDKRGAEALAREYAELGRTLGEALLEPTVLYAPRIARLRERYTIAGVVHVTGGGLVENPVRILPEGLTMRIQTGTWDVPAIFEIIQSTGNITDEEMRHVFNCGLGLLVVSPDDLSGEYPLVGEVVESERTEVVFMR